MSDKQASLDGDKRRLRPPKKPGWKAVFLEELGKWGVVDHAIRTAGVAVSTAYKARERDEHFAAQWDEAEGKLLATAEVIARQRALVGHPRPVYFQGQKVDTIQEIDNVHLRWLLSKLKPSVYGDKVDLNLKHSGTVEVHVYLPDNDRGDVPSVEPSRNGHDPVPTR
jgi:hypothetical protein